MDTIKEQATIDARDEFIAIDNSLENLKEKVSQFKLEENDITLAGIGLLSAGIFLGTKVPKPISWLVGFLSGTVTAYSGVSILVNILKSPTEKTEEKSLKEALDDYQTYEPDAKF